MANGQLYDVGMASNDPIPFYGSLAKVLHGPTISIVLTYLEIHHPPAADGTGPSSSLSSTPILIDCDVISTTLGVSRRTLHVALVCLGTFWSTEAERVRAARVGREFLNPAHSLKPTGHDPIKIYSFTGSRNYQQPRTLLFRRNYAKLVNVLTLAGLRPPQVQMNDIQATGAKALTAFTLPGILESVLPDWLDRRSGRWDRWRAERGRKPTNLKRMRQARSS